MKTLFGKEAQNGDYVLVNYAKFPHGAVNTVPAFVVNGKAYTGNIVQKTLNDWQWLRKTEAIIVIDRNLVSEELRTEITKNIEATSVKDIGNKIERKPIN